MESSNPPKANPIQAPQESDTADSLPRSESGNDKDTASPEIPLASSSSDGRKARTYLSRENINTILASLGLALALWGYIQNLEQGRRDSRIEANDLLNEATDLIGGREGTGWIQETTEDRTSLELARRNIDKALRLDNKNSRAHLSLAYYYIAYNRPELSLDSLERAIELDSSLSGRRYHFAHILESDGHLEETEELYRTLVLNDRNKDSLTALAQFLSSSKKYDEAIEVFRQVLELGQDSHSARSLAGVLQSQGRVAEAKRTLTKTIEHGEVDEEILIDLAQLEGRSGNSELAESYYKQAIASPKSSDRAYVAYGYYLGYRGRVAEAKVQFEKALKLDPDNNGANIALAELHYRLLEPRIAEVYYRRVLDERDSSGVRGRLAEILVLQKRLGEAETMFESLIEREPQQLQHYEAYSEFLLFIGRAKDAERTLVEATLQVSRPGSAWSALGRFYERQGRFEEAEMAFREAALLHPDQIQTQYNLARIRDRRFNNGELESFLTAALRNDDRFYWAAAKLAPIHEEKGEVNEALALYRNLSKRENGCGFYIRYMNLKEHQPQGEHQGEKEGLFKSSRLAELVEERYRGAESCYYQFALSLSSAGDLDGAEELLQTIVERSPGNTDYKFELGRISYSRNDLEAAVSAFEEVVRLNPRDTRSYRCLAEVMRVQKDEERAVLFDTRAKTVDEMLGNPDQEIMNCQP